MLLVNILTYIILAFSLGIFYWFAKFTAKLIRQHYDVFGLLYELEEAEKNRRR